MMKLTDLTGIIKACSVKLNNTPSKNLWDVVWNSEIDKNLLTMKNGRCYFIMVNDIIYKIGYSDSKGGIRNTIGSYKSSGNSGRPSDRTHGIHILIAEQLLLGNKVEFWFQYTENHECEITLMDGSTQTKSIIISGKELEKANVEIYKNRTNEYPVWNLQEANKPWPKHIQESRSNLLNNISVTLNGIKERMSISSF